MLRLSVPLLVAQTHLGVLVLMKYLHKLELRGLSSLRFHLACPQVKAHSSQMASLNMIHLSIVDREVNPVLWLHKH